METTGNNQIAEKYFSSGGRKYDIQDFLGAIADYTRALELNPKQHIMPFSKIWPPCRFVYKSNFLRTAQKNHYS